MHGNAPNAQNRIFIISPEKLVVKAFILETAVREAPNESAEADGERYPSPKLPADFFETVYKKMLIMGKSYVIL